MAIESRPLSTRALLIAALLAIPAAPTAAQGRPTPDAAADGNADAETAERTEAAREHFERGVAFYRDGDLEGALVEFKRAMDVQPNYKLLFNLGQVSQELRDYPAAERYFRDYLTQGGDGIDAERRQRVEAELDKLAGRIARLSLTSNLPGTEFLVDGVPVGQAPLDGPVKVGAGRRHIVANHGGRASISRMVDVAGRETLIVHLEFPSEAPDTAAAGRGALEVERSAALEPGDDGGVHPAVWIGVASTALLAGGGVMAYLTSRDEDDYREELSRLTTQERLDELSERAKDKALVTDILLGAGAVGALTTLIVALAVDGERAPPHDMTLHIGPGRATLSGRF